MTSISSSTALTVLEEGVKDALGASTPLRGLILGRGRRLVVSWL